MPPTYPPPFERIWLSPRFWPLWLGFGLLRLVTALPGAWRRALGTLAGYLAWFYNRKRRRFVDLNLAWCFPELDAAAQQALARRFFHVFARTALDYALLWWGGAERLRALVAVEGEDEVARRLAAGRRVILFTGHSVALDFGATAASLRWPIVGPMKQARNPLVNWVIARGRTRFDCHTYPREMGIRPVVRDVRAGRVMYYLPDEDLGQTQKCVFAPFFGVPTATLTALARLARACDADVLPCMTYYDLATGRYRLRISPALEGFPTFDEERDAAIMNAQLERLIRFAPEQYLWSMRLFQTRPAGAANPYREPPP